MYLKRPEFATADPQFRISVRFQRCDSTAGENQDVATQTAKTTIARIKMHGVKIIVKSVSRLRYVV